MEEAPGDRDRPDAPDHEGEGPEAEMRITKRSPIRRMVREIEKLWEGDDGFEEMSVEQLSEWLCTIAVYIERTLYRVDNLQKRIEELEAQLRRPK
jgi:hypothetical protein